MTWHITSDIQSLSIGDGTTIWQYVVILPNAKIGSNVNICSHCFIENDVYIGDRTTIKSGVQLWDGLWIGSDVFIGPNVTFTNDKFPRSKIYPKQFAKTIIEDGVSIGANSTILPGITVGRNSLIGAGSVVTKSVPPNSIICGNPANFLDKNKSNSSRFERLGIESIVCDQIPTFVDRRGALSASDFSALIPFSINRFFIVHGVSMGVERGGHAHHVCHQYLICTSGSVEVTLDNGLEQKVITLSTPSQGLYIPPKIWALQKYKSANSSLLVFASHSYDPEDYLLTYSDYLRALK